MSKDLRLVNLFGFQILNTNRTEEDFQKYIIVLHIVEMLIHLKQLDSFQSSLKKRLFDSMPKSRRRTN